MWLSEPSEPVTRRKKNRMVSKPQGENAEFWGRWAYAGYDDGMRNENYQKLSRRIAEEVGSVGRVLDVATGTGLAALELAKNVGLVEAIDFAPEMIAVAQRKADEMKATNVKFSLGSAYELEFPDHVFDAVVILNALHAMEQPGRALAEARRVLKPEGLLIVPTPCHGETQETRAQLQKIESSGFKDYQLFSEERLCEMVQSGGFAVIRRERLEWVFEETRFRMLVGYVVARPS